MPEPQNAATAALIAAIDARDPDALRAALARGGDPEAPAEGGWTALHALAAYGLRAELGALLGAGLDPDPRDEAGGTPLHYAADAETAHLLLEGGADLLARDNDGGTAAHTRVGWEGAEPVLTELVCRGLPPDLEDDHGESPVARAIAAEQDALVPRILALGADPDLLLPDGRPCLHWYAEVGDAMVIDQILLEGADPVLQDAHGKKPRFYADPHRVLRRTFRRKRYDPWEAPPLAEALATLAGRSAEASSSSESPVETWLEAVAGGAVTTDALTLFDQPAPPWTWAELVEGGADAAAPLVRVGRDPMGREALLVRPSGRFLCLWLADLRDLLALGARLVGVETDALVGFLEREVATLGAQDVAGLLTLLDDRRALEFALNARRKWFNRAGIRRGMDWLRPWVPEYRTLWDERVVPLRGWLGELLADLPDDGPRAFYHPRALAVRWGLEDPVHPLTHGFLDATRGVDTLAGAFGLKGWRGLAAQPRPAEPSLVLGQAPGGAPIRLHLTTGRVAVGDDAAWPVELPELLGLNRALDGAGDPLDRAAEGLGIERAWVEERLAVDGSLRALVG